MHYMNDSLQQHNAYNKNFRIFSIQDMNIACLANIILQLFNFWPIKEMQVWSTDVWSVLNQGWHWNREWFEEKDSGQWNCQTPLQLANPTQLQLVWVGVDFVFPWKKEGRRSNPHLASSRRNDPTCLNFGDCVVGASGGCWEIVRRVSGGCLLAV